MAATRILTTHTGSLPRPPELVPMLEAQARGDAYDAALLEKRVAEEVVAIVRRQADCGIDIVNDGEMGKHSYNAYVKDRLSGFTRTGTPRPVAPADSKDYPEFFQRGAERRVAFLVPVCEGAIAYTGHDAVARDCANLRNALADVHVEGAFLSAASPGVIARFIENRHYPNHEAYLSALAEAMKIEYDAIYKAGFLLQIDCPDMTGNRDIPGMAPGTDYLQLHIDALNQAVRDIPSEAMRIHLCWGNYEGPHHLDTPLGNLLARVLTARPAALVIEGANPRHAHEWTLFRDRPLPPDRTIVTGVLDTTTNFIEHPDLIALRLEQYASVVGRERVTAGTDCGFATLASHSLVDPKIAWGKLAAMVEGARIASSRLW